MRYLLYRAFAFFDFDRGKDNGPTVEAAVDVYEASFRVRLLADHGHTT